MCCVKVLKMSVWSNRVTSAVFGFTLTVTTVTLLTEATACEFLKKALEEW